MATDIDFSTLRRPLPALIAANVLVTLLCMALNLAGFPQAATMLVLPAGWSAWLMRPWAIVTYMFVQWGFLHLLFNMLWLWCFGRIFLSLASGGALLRLYAAGGVAGAVVALTAATVGASAAGPLAGASAAVIAVGVASAVMAPDFGISLFLLGRVSLKWIVAAIVVLFCVDMSSGLCGVASHAGGIAAGLCYGLWRRGAFGRLSARRPRSKAASGQETSSADDHAELDRLLDKVRRSGYASLSTSERRRLFDISSRIK